MMVRTVLSVVLALVAAVAEDVPAGKQPVPDKEVPLERWIAQLGSDNYRDREVATQKLLARQDALPALQRALESADPEVRRRATVIRATLTQSLAEKAIKDLTAEVQPGRIDKLVELLVKEEGAAAEKHWPAMFRTAGELTAKGSHLRGKAFRTPGDELARIPLSRGGSAEDAVDRRLILAGAQQKITSLRRCVLVCDGAVQHLGRVEGSIVLVNGNIQSCTRISNSIVFCRGDLGEVNSIEGSIILVAGKLDQVLYAADNLIQAKETGRFTASRNNVYLNLESIAAAFPEDDRFVTPGNPTGQAAAVPAPVFLPDLIPAPVGN